MAWHVSAVKNGKTRWGKLVAPNATNTKKKPRCLSLAAPWLDNCEEEHGGPSSSGKSTRVNGGKTRGIYSDIIEAMDPP
jgi:hypothetical protein